MRLVRNITPDGKCKYALVRLDKMRTTDETSRAEIETALATLIRKGVLEYGEPGSTEEFFVLKLKDKFTAAALDTYCFEVFKAFIDGQSPDKKSLSEYCDDLSELLKRATNHPSRKLPD